MIFNSLGSNYNFAFVMRSFFGLGGDSDRVELEKYLSEKYNGKTVLLYKGREAIKLAFDILNLPKGSAVAINGYTCYAVYQPIVEAGLKVEYLDITQSNLNFSADALLKKLETADVKAVIAQNTLGFVCDIEAIAEICRQKNIILIEDLAHSAGAKYKNGRETGSYGDFVILSFSQDKIIDAVSGGALVIKNNKYQNFAAPILKALSAKQKFKDRLYPSFTFKIRFNYAWGFGKVYHKFLKRTGLLSTPMGADEQINLHGLSGWYCKLALREFKNLKGNISRREKIAEIYAKNLKSDFLISSDVENSTNLRFPILVSERKDLINFLKTKGVHVSDIWYDAPIAPEKYLSLTDYKHQCPNAEKVSATMLNLPTHINVNEKSAKKIVDLINQWQSQQR